MKVVNKDILKKCIGNNVPIGHSKKRWEYRNINNVLMEMDSTYIIDPNVIIEKLDEACKKLEEIVSAKGKILFVCTKRIASGYIKKVANELNMPYVTARWSAGMITNFFVVKKMMKKSENLNNILNSKDYSHLSKKEQLILKRSIKKRDVILDGINKKLYRTPSAMIVVDILKEKIAVKEAAKTGIPIFGLVDTNSYSDYVKYQIPCNDDSLSSIIFVVEHLKAAILKGLSSIKENED